MRWRGEVRAEEARSFLLIGDYRTLWFATVWDVRDPERHILFPLNPEL